MQSSDHSPSRRSFGSYGEESRTDPELHGLVGGQMREVEIREEEVEEKPGDDSSNETSSRKSTSNDKPLENLDEIPSASSSSVSSKKPNKPSKSRLDSETSSRSRPKGKSPPEKPPINWRNDKHQQKQNTWVTRTTKPKVSPSRRKSQNQTQNLTDLASDKPEQAPILLKQARDLMSSGDNQQKALELALQAMTLFKKHAIGKPSLGLVMCSHVTAAIYCSLGQYSEAIPILGHSIEIPVIEEGQEHALAKFASHMQLGDTYAMLGQLGKSIMCYNTGLEIQRQVLGETDPRVGETCRYVAEAHVQALQFDEAEKLCQMALDIHKANGSPQSPEEAADRRLMGLICETKGKHEAALEHLVLASMAMVANGQEAEVASVDCSIGDAYLSMLRYDEAVLAYQKALTAFKTSKGENHLAVGSVYVRLADLYNRTGKIRESKSYCESALRIYEQPMPGALPEEIASGLTDVSAIYESMNELEQALELLQKALEIYNDAPGQLSTIAGIEAQMGVMYYMLGKYAESYSTFKSAITKLRATGEKKSAFMGIALNQMGLACVQRYALSEATTLFEEAKTIFEQEYGPYHPETLGVCSNLAGTYDAIGRLDEAIEILEYIVRTREEKLGTANPDVDNEKRRLDELLKEAGRVRSREARSLENLLDGNEVNMATQSASPPDSTAEKPQSPGVAAEIVQPTNVGQQNGREEPVERSSPTSVFVNSEPMREEQIQNAVKFLSHPRVRGSPVVHRRAFLEKKGLTKEEIDEAFRRVPDSPPTGQTAGTKQDEQLKPSPNLQQQAQPQTLQPGVSASTGATTSLVALSRSRFHWSHALIAIGILAASGAGTAVLIKKSVLPWLKSWIRKVVLEQDNDQLKKIDSKPTSEEEAAQAAKAAAAAAADVAKATQQMLTSKSEERQYFEEFSGLLDKQVQEMKSMTNAIRRLEGQTIASSGAYHLEPENHRVTQTSSKQPFVNGKVDYDLRSVRSSSPSVSIKPSAASHPKSYMEIMAMVQRGEKPSNIRDINDAPPNPNQQPSNPRLTPKAKPWEVSQVQNSSTQVLQYQVNGKGLDYNVQGGIQTNGDIPVPWWERKNVRIREVENENGLNAAHYGAQSSQQPVQRAWVPPQPPPIAMAEAAEAISRPKPMVRQEEAPDDETVAQSSDKSDEVVTIKTSEYEGAIKDSSVSSGEIQENKFEEK
ncbi:hypothetical protein L6164_011066 [Bauhinia variegata]|uniref:Uncharacterized protein n=1 Tax=Bauhinia variegata TaxID=167791 RepID=A0ACB9P6W8_BAUVA|nr:hypothetical protein L6164_011066 [Bauhinia variegata]